MQAKLADETVEGSAGGGMVKVIARGDQRITKIEIDAAALQEDKDMLQDLIVAAVNQALEKTKELAGQKMGSMLPPGMMPGGGLGGLLGG
jgi:DNA-binding YbaB/EbfC family protein